MKRTYTLFIATSELLTCPDIYQRAKAHNLILTPNTTRIISVVTPLEEAPGDLRESQLDFDPYMVAVNGINLMHEDGLLYLSLGIRAKDVGVSTITLTIPEAKMYRVPNLQIATD